MLSPTSSDLTELQSQLSYKCILKEEPPHQHNGGDLPSRPLPATIREVSLQQPVSLFAYTAPLFCSLLPIKPLAFIALQRSFLSA